MSKPKKKFLLRKKSSAPENQDEKMSRRSSDGSTDDIDCLCMKHINANKVFKCKAFLKFSKRKKSKKPKDVITSIF